MYKLLPARFVSATGSGLPEAVVRRMSMLEGFGEQNVDWHSESCLRGEYYSLSMFGVSLDNESIM